MRRNVIEIILGAIVLIVAGFFLLFAYSSANFSSIQGYELTAQFDDLGGIQVGDRIRISGVDVGRITKIQLDQQTFRADISLLIDQNIDLPLDTFAVITSDGLLGGKFLSLEPGSKPDTLPPGGHIEWTQSTPGFEQLLGQVIYNLQSLGNQPPDHEDTP